MHAHVILLLSRAETVLEVCKSNGIAVEETDFSLADVYAADECFVTGTFAGVVPVSEVDGRSIGDASIRFTAPQVGTIQRISTLYKELVKTEASDGRRVH